jgi:hypothetical protein
MQWIRSIDISLSFITFSTIFTSLERGQIAETQFRNMVHRTNEWMAGAGNAGLCGGMAVWYDH